MHFSATTFITPYLHQFSAVVKKIPFFVEQICIIFGANLASLLKKFKKFISLDNRKKKDDKIAIFLLLNPLGF